MHHPQIKHTIDIFERIYNNLPPKVPETVREEMAHALEHLHNDYTITTSDVEEMVIALGKKVWPYWKAFEEFFNIYQGKLGEKFLLGKLSPALKNRYLEFKEHGATYHDLRLGGPLNFFDDAERQIMSGEFVEVDKIVRGHVRQLVMSTEQKKYEELVISFQTILDDIEKRLDNLRLVAEDEAEHPQLAEEIRSQVQAFEFGLCLLGPNTRYQEVMNMDDYMIERRATKKFVF